MNRNEAINTLIISAQCMNDLGCDGCPQDKEGSCEGTPSDDMVREAISVMRGENA